jgi:glycosyltransferase involved in cell wall biosynthesis
MRLFFVTPYFPPEVGAPQTRIHELGVRLARMGHDVRVLTTFPSYPSGVVPPEWRGKLFCRHSSDGLTIYRVWSYAAANRGFLKRIAAHLSFAVFASVASLVLSRPDALIVESPPLFDGFIGVTANVLRRIPYLFMVSDLWPESAVQMGALRNRFLIRASKSIELLFYRRSAAVLALTAGIRNGIIADRIHPDKVLLFRNSVDCDFFRPGLATCGLRAEMGVKDSDFLVVYAGTLGMAHNLSTALQAAALLQAEGATNVRFVLAGDGADCARLKAQAQELALDNVSFLAPMKKAQVPQLLNAADCVLVPLRNLEIFRGALPTKMFEAMACAKPVLLSVRGEAEEIIEAAAAGYCIDPESPAALRDAVLALRQNPPKARAMGENGRKYVENHFRREMRARELSSALETLSHGSGRSSPVSDANPQQSRCGTVR